MRKIFIALILFCISMPVYANGFTNFFKDFFAPATEKFIKIEKDVRLNTLQQVQQKTNDIWFMKDTNIIKYFSLPMRTRKLVEKEDGKLYPYPNREEEFKKLTPESFDKAFAVNKKYIDEYYNTFKSNKNNMAQNKQICDDLYEDFYKQYNDISVYLEKIHKEEFDNYRNNLNRKTLNLAIRATDGKDYPIYRCGKGCPDPKKLCRTEDWVLKCDLVFNDLEGVEVLENWEELIPEDRTKSKIFDIYKSLYDNIAYLEKVQNEIKNYSIDYETQKLKKYYKKYGNIKKCNGTIATYFTIGVDTPQKGCYYDVPVTIFQKVPGGFLANDPYSDYAGLAYIVSGTKDPRGTYYFPLRLLYQGGFYNYTNLLGEFTKVDKFIIIDIPNEDFYFINK